MDKITSKVDELTSEMDEFISKLRNPRNAYHETSSKIEELKKENEKLDEEENFLDTQRMNFLASFDRNSIKPVNKKLSKINIIDDYHSSRNIENEENFLLFGDEKIPQFEEDDFSQFEENDFSQFEEDNFSQFEEDSFSHFNHEKRDFNRLDGKRSFPQYEENSLSFLDQPQWDVINNDYYSEEKEKKKTFDEVECTAKILTKAENDLYNYIFEYEDSYEKYTLISNEYADEIYQRVFTNGEVSLYKEYILTVESEIARINAHKAHITYINIIKNDKKLYFIKFESEYLKKGNSRELNEEVEESVLLYKNVHDLFINASKIDIKSFQSLNNLKYKKFVDNVISISRMKIYDSYISYFSVLESYNKALINYEMCC
jgi:hypothetical protein